MASSYISSGVVEESGKRLHNGSPRNVKRPTWASGSPTHSQDHGHHGPPMCVCAPATHAGSFKCRLHRSNSHVSAPQSPTIPRQTSDATMVSKTVEAQ